MLTTLTSGNYVNGIHIHGAKTRGAEMGVLPKAAVMRTARPAVAITANSWYFWPIWPILGGATGLTSHALSIPKNAQR
jgi:hypothetical protein